MRLKQPFTERLKDSDSDEFKTLAAKIEYNLEDLLKRHSNHNVPGLSRIKVISFHSGSTVATVLTEFPSRSDGNVKFVAASLQMAILSGALDSLGLVENQTIQPVEYGMVILYTVYVDWSHLCLFCG